jgi:SOS-response transcriptional repressor LexA
LQPNKLTVQHFQEQLNELIKRFNGDRKKAADSLRVSRSYISQLLSGTRKPSDAQMRLLELTLAIKDASAGSNVGLLESEPLRKIRVVSWTTAGEMASYEDLANQIDELTDSTTRDPNAFAVEVVGDSMEKEVHPGDYVILEPNREASSGEMAYVRLIDEAGGVGTLKWFYRSGPQGRVIKLVAENPDWPTTEHPVETVKFAYPVHNIIRRRPKRRIQ